VHLLARKQTIGQTLGTLLKFRLWPPSHLAVTRTGLHFVYFARTLWRLVGLLRSRRWSTATATILGVHLGKGFYNSVSVDYEYGVDAPKYACTFVKPFIFESSAKAYADQLKRGMQFRIRIKPGNPEVSLADPGEENW